jgi:glutaminyl-peptide cyclotransferase
MAIRRPLAVLVLPGLLTACTAFQFPEKRDAPVLDVEVVEVFYHDRDDFTQGLVYDKGVVYESTGLSGRSRLLKRNLISGEILAVHKLPTGWFGEGLALLDKVLYQLTWQEGICQVYEAETLKPLGRHRYDGEGWGIAVAGNLLVMSDGSQKLVFRSPETFGVVKSLTVRDGKREIHKLNELEVVGDSIYANVFGSDRIARINKSTGRVESWLDLTAIVAAEQSSSRQVLNGIAYRPDTGHLLVTGKNWRHIYEIRPLSAGGIAR